MLVISTMPVVSRFVPRHVNLCGGLERCVVGVRVCTRGSRLGVSVGFRVIRFAGQCLW